jgi:CRP-like cAMP-binding protein
MIRKRPIDSYLTEHPLFAGCSKRQLKELSGLATAVTLRAGRTLAREGEVAQELVLIENGRVQVKRNDTIVATLGRGDFFGEIALIRACRHTATVYAETDIEAQVISQRDLWRMLEVAPRLSAVLIVENEQRLQNLQNSHRVEPEKTSA